MKVFSTKNPLVIKFEFALLLLLTISPEVSASRYTYLLRTEGRAGVHLFEPSSASSTMATHRYGLDFEQKAEFNKEWSAKFGFRTLVEAAYVTESSAYNDNIRDLDTQSLFIRDTYVQYKKQSLQILAGYQQVVWGEAFGAYYADIVNAKDLREFGLGNLADNRLTAPLLSISYLREKFSTQLIYIPRPVFHLLPVNGSDFFPLSASQFGAAELNVKRKEEDSPNEGEWGGRITSQIGDVDFSFFYLKYFDRFPTYNAVVIAAAPLSIELRPEHKKLQTFGFTFTTDLDLILLRGEALLNQDRSWNILEAGNLTTKTSDEYLYVVGMDFPKIDAWQVGTQFTESLLAEGEYLLRPPRQSMASLRLAKTLPSNSELEIVFSRFLSHPSSLTQIKYMIPVSSALELNFLVDWFDGASETEFGRYHRASRFMFMLRGYFRG